MPSPFRLARTRLSSDLPKLGSSATQQEPLMGGLANLLDSSALSLNLGKADLGCASLIRSWSNLRDINLVFLALMSIIF